MKVHCKIKKNFRKNNSALHSNIPNMFWRVTVRSNCTELAFYSINIPNSNTPPHMDHLLCSLSKRFTNVVKTIANSTTYCRKPGDCNGTNIFEINIMKNSSPLNLKFTIFAMSKPN